MICSTVGIGLLSPLIARLIISHQICYITIHNPRLHMWVRFILALVQPSLDKVSLPTSSLLLLPYPGFQWSPTRSPKFKLHWATGILPGELFRTATLQQTNILYLYKSTIIFPTLGGELFVWREKRFILPSPFHCKFSSWETQWSCSTTPATEPARDCQARRLVSRWILAIQNWYTKCYCVNSIKVESSTCNQKSISVWCPLDVSRCTFLDVPSSVMNLTPSVEISMDNCGIWSLEMCVSI